MKYYIYISDAKVDMLLPQITDGQKKKIATEFGFDLKILHAKRTAEYDVNDDRIARLEAVVSFIREFGNLGTIEEPDDYIEDSATMQSLLLGRKQELAYFGTVQNTSTIGLAGSSKHLIGASPMSGGHGMPSLTAGIMQLLRVALAGTDDVGKAYPGGLDVLEAMHSQLNKLGVARENLRFMAKRLLLKPKGELPALGEQIILATPLYISKED